MTLFSRMLTSLWIVLLCSSSVSADQESSMLGLRTAVYSVDDIDKAKNWYAEAFGVEPYFDQAYYVGFNIRGFELGLMPTSNEKVPSDNVVAYWGVDNIEQEFTRLVSLGAKSVSPITDVGGGIKLGVLEDPFGNALGLIFNPHFRASQNP